VRTESKVAKAVDEYIARFPDEVRRRLERIRTTIRKAAPEAVEKISYRMPTFTLRRNLVHFAGYRNHIGFYPGASAVRKFKRELSNYAGAVGSVRFSHAEPIPHGLIARIVKFRVRENSAQTARRKKKPAPRR
jgi:uncharacterized protein YdhG (YjbR/CyaY superfamily)